MRATPRKCMCISFVRGIIQETNLKSSRMRDKEEHRLKTLFPQKFKLLAFVRCNAVEAFLM